MNKQLLIVILVLSVCNIAQAVLAVESNNTFRRMLASARELQAADARLKAADDDLRATCRELGLQLLSTYE